MNILVIYDGYSKIGPKGSVLSVVFHLSKTLVQMGHNVTILERKGTKEDKSIEHIEGIRFVRLNARKLASSGNEVLYNFPFNLVHVILDGLVFARSVSSWLRKEKQEFDIVHVHLPFASSILALFNRKLRQKMVYTFNGDAYRVNLESKVRVPWYVRLLSPDLFLMKRVKKVTVLNNSIYSKLVASNVVSPHNIAVIGNGIDVNMYRPDTDTKNIEAKFAMNSKTAILFAGTFFPRKGVEYLIKAADILINQLDYGNLLFLLVGDLTLDKGYVNQMSNLIHDFGLEEQVKLIDKVPRAELLKLYTASALFACPSPEEPFGLVVTEAMACGKPVIGTRVGGIIMQVRDGWNGLLVEPGNEADLAEKIRYLVDHPEERLRMGANGRKRAEDEFSWERIAEEYIKVYRQVQTEK